MNMHFRASRRVPLNPVAIDGIVDGIGPIADRAGLYLFVGILFLMLIARIVAKGPDEEGMPTTSTAAAAAT